MADERFREIQDEVKKIRGEVGKVVVGVSAHMKHVFHAFMLGTFMYGDTGHVVVEGAPGTGKTLMMHAVARTCKSEVVTWIGNEDDRAERVLGYWKTKLGSDELIYVPGLLTRHAWEMLFARFGTAQRAYEALRNPALMQDAIDPLKLPMYLNHDELNRSTSQALDALLEPLQELQVTVGGVSFPLNPAFRTISSRNPFDARQTVDPSRAWWDRQGQQINAPIPAEEDMYEIIRRGDLLAHQKEALAQIQSVLTVGDVLDIRRFIRDDVVVEPAMERYLAKLLKGTDQEYLLEELGLEVLEIPSDDPNAKEAGEKYNLRTEQVIKKDSEGQSGVAGRVAVTLRQLAKTNAALHGSRFARPEHVKQIFMQAIEHHIVLNERLHGRRSRVARAIVNEILRRVAEPKEGELHAS